MENKVLNISYLITVILISSSFFMVPVRSLPINKSPCDICHNTDGIGSLLSTYLDESVPENNIFILIRPENSSILLRGIGDNEESKPGIALIFDPAIYHHVIIEGAIPGEEGSNSFYIRDGDLNDQDPEPGNVEGIFQISIDSSAHNGIFNVTAVYLQEGPAGITVDLILKVEGGERKTGFISLLVSPTLAYLNDDLIFISGSIRPEDAEIVILEYKIINGWQSLDILTIKENGSFFHEWQPDKIEDYSLRVRFEGDDEYKPVISDVFNISVLKSPQTLNSQIITAVLLALAILIIGSTLFYLAGRSRYNKRIAGIKF